MCCARYLPLLGGVTAAIALNLSAIASTRHTQHAQELPSEFTAPEISGVVAGGTKVQLIDRWEPAHGGEGPVAAPDGSLLFAKQDLDQIVRIDKDDRISLYLEGTYGAMGLGFDSKGRLIALGAKTPRVGVLVFEPVRAVLADTFDGQPLSRPNDLVIDRKGGVYFSDVIASTPPGPPPPPARQPTVMYLKPDGTVIQVTEGIRPNGVQLSPDERVLYVAARGEFVLAYDVEPDGRLQNQRNFARIADPGVEGGADGLAIDAAGRLYVATPVGIQVFSREGHRLGTIPIPTRPANLAFAGSDKKTLYVVGRGAAYKIQMRAQGFKARAK